MRKWTLLLFGPALALALTASPAVAGGWAMSSLDALPELRAGKVTEVGFTVRQHGVQPVDVGGGGSGVAIEVTDPSGAVETFTATRRGTVGHYVAPVVFREVGRYTWLVQQGVFGPQPLGAIDITATASASAAAAEAPKTSPVSTAGYRWPAPLRVALVVLAISFVTAAFVDVSHLSRRRRIAGASA